MNENNHDHDEEEKEKRKDSKEYCGNGEEGGRVLAQPMRRLNVATGS